MSNGPFPPSLCSVYLGGAALSSFVPLLLSEIVISVSTLGPLSFRKMSRKFSRRLEVDVKKSIDIGTESDVFLHFQLSVGSEQMY